MFPLLGDALKGYGKDTTKLTSPDGLALVRSGNSVKPSVEGIVEF